MKKLTKRVQIFDLFIDVPKNTFHVAADSDGQLRAVSSEVTVIRGIDGWRYSVNDGGEVTCVCRVDLEGLNWWECCWFVGNQGDETERREWMARGVELLGSHYEQFEPTEMFSYEWENFRDKIRSGEVDL